MISGKSKKYLDKFMRNVSLKWEKMSMSGIKCREEQVSREEKNKCRLSCMNRKTILFN